MEINIGDKVKYLSVKGPSEGIVENYDGTQAVVKLPSGKAVVCHRNSLISPEGAEPGAQIHDVNTGERISPDREAAINDWIKRRVCAVVEGGFPQPMINSCL